MWLCGAVFVFRVWPSIRRCLWPAAFVFWWRLDAFSNGEPAVKKVIQEKHRVSNADGESAAQLGFRLAKEMNILPNQRAVLRCEGHFTQCALKHALSLVLDSGWGSACICAYALKHACVCSGMHAVSRSLPRSHCAASLYHALGQNSLPTCIHIPHPTITPQSRLSDPEVAELMQRLVFKLSPPKSKDRGSLSRAISNSHGLKHKFGQAVVETIKGLAEEADKLSAALHKHRRNDGKLSCNSFCLSRLVLFFRL